MRYVSTRWESPPVGFTEAVALGLAPDGGLYLPENLPNLEDKLRDWEGLAYPDLCFSFLKEFATDMPEDVLADVASADGAAAAEAEGGVDLASGDGVAGGEDHRLILV